jgi:hypothetical protein
VHVALSNEWYARLHASTLHRGAVALAAGCGVGSFAGACSEGAAPVVSTLRRAFSSIVMTRTLLFGCAARTGAGLAAGAAATASDVGASAKRALDVSIGTRKNIAATATPQPNAANIFTIGPKRTICNSRPYLTNEASHGRAFQFPRRELDVALRNIDLRASFPV